MRSIFRKKTTLLLLISNTFLWLYLILSFSHFPTLEYKMCICCLKCQKLSWTGLSHLLYWCVLTVTKLKPSDGALKEWCDMIIKIGSSWKSIWILSQFEQKCEWHVSFSCFSLFFMCASNCGCAISALTRCLKWCVTLLRLDSVWRIRSSCNRTTSLLTVYAPLVCSLSLSLSPGLSFCVDLLLSLFLSWSLSLSVFLSLSFLLFSGPSLFYFTWMKRLLFVFWYGVQKFPPSPSRYVLPELENLLCFVTLYQNNLLY